jgi:hypothetical protein
MVTTKRFRTSRPVPNLIKKDLAAKVGRGTSCCEGMGSSAGKDSCRS